MNGRAAIGPPRGTERGLLAHQTVGGAPFAQGLGVIVEVVVGIFVVVAAFTLFTRALRAQVERQRGVGGGVGGEQLSHPGGRRSRPHICGMGRRKRHAVAAKHTHEQGEQPAQGM